MLKKRPEVMLCAGSGAVERGVAVECVSFSPESVTFCFAFLIVGVGDRLPVLCQSASLRLTTYFPVACHVFWFWCGVCGQSSV